MSCLIYWDIHFKPLRDGLITLSWLMCSNNPHVFPIWHCVHTHRPKHLLKISKTLYPGSRQEVFGIAHTLLTMTLMNQIILIMFLQKKLNNIFHMTVFHFDSLVVYFIPFVLAQCDLRSRWAIFSLVFISYKKIDDKQAWVTWRDKAPHIYWKRQTLEEQLVWNLFSMFNSKSLLRKTLSPWVTNNRCLFQPLSALIKVRVTFTDMSRYPGNLPRGGVARQMPQSTSNNSSLWWRDSSLAPAWKPSPSDDVTTSCKETGAKIRFVFSSPSQGMVGSFTGVQSPIHSEKSFYCG